VQCDNLGDYPPDTHLVALVQAQIASWGFVGEKMVLMKNFIRKENVNFVRCITGEFSAF